jgi:hypothetical protein
MAAKTPAKKKTYKKPTADRLDDSDLQEVAGGEELGCSSPGRPALACRTGGAAKRACDTGSAATSVCNPGGGVTGACANGRGPYPMS